MEFDRMLGALLGAWLAGAAVAPAAAAEGPRVAWVEGTTAVPAVERAFTELAEAVERGDRGAFVRLVAPAERADAQALADALVGTASRPRAAVRVEIVTCDIYSVGWRGSVLVRARTAPRASDLPPPPEGFVRAGQGEAALALTFVATRTPQGAVLLALRPGTAARVTAVSFDSDFAEGLVSARCVARLEVEEALPVTVLFMGPGLAVRAGAAGVTLTAFESLDGQLDVLRVARPRGGPAASLELESVLTIDEGSRKGGVTYLTHQEAWMPFARGLHFRFEATVDVPAPQRSVMVGLPEDLPAREGRRRTRWTVDRAVDYVPVAVAPYEVVAVGEGALRLELWRTRDVGGDPKAILAELRRLVDWQEEHGGALPYRALRLVEAPVGEGYAVSYASVIFMTPGMLATAEQRVEILSHEVAHQWWGNAVDPAPHARWASEGMADALRDLFVLRQLGAEAYRERQDRHVQALLASLGAGTRPLGTSSGGGDAYHRGALFVHALREQVGEEAFWRILARWYERFAATTPETADFRREAEAVTGGSLGAVFDPWLGATALPVVRLAWSTKAAPPGALVTVTLEQDAPHFPLEVPVRAVGPDGAQEDWTVRLLAATATSERALPFAPTAVLLDPDEHLPRVTEDDLAHYLAAEAEALLGRGEACGARDVLRRLASVQPLLSMEHATLVFGARVLCGEAAGVARRDLDVVIAEQATPTSRASAFLAAADSLAAQGAAALPLLEALDAEVADGAAVPRRLGIALRALGREEEAAVAFARALARRPADAATRTLLGLAPAADDAEAARLEDLVTKDTPGFAESASSRSVVLALSKGRFAVLLGGGRRLLTGRAGALQSVPALAPTGPQQLVAVDAAALTVRCILLDGDRRSARLVVVDIDGEGRGRVIATHERVPGGVQALVASQDAVLLAWTAPEGAWSWRRLTVPLGESSAGPDDDDGLKRILPKDDARFAEHGVTPAPPDSVTGPGAVLLAGLGLVVVSDDGRRLAGVGGVAWEEPVEGGGRILAARRHGDGLALVVSADRSRSPFEEDALAECRLVVLSGDDLRERILPPDAADASVAPEGTLGVRTVRPGCGAPTFRLLHGRLELDSPVKAE